MLLKLKQMKTEDCPLGLAIWMSVSTTVQMDFRDNETDSFLIRIISREMDSSKCSYLSRPDILGTRMLWWEKREVEK